MKTPQQKENLNILFSDISQSTRIYETHGDTKALEIINKALDIISHQIISYHGRVLKKIGDEVMCAFPNTDNAVHAACASHTAIQSDEFLSKFQLAIKTGIHVGEVLTEGNDVFGDNVNIASRMVSLAKRDQIIATRETVEQLSQNLRSKTRALGRTSVKGKRKHIEIMEVLWQEDFSELTIMPGMLQDERKPRSALFLRYADQEIEVKNADTTVELGRGEQNTIVIRNGMVSRLHASIKHRQGKFVLVDHSSNGTFISSELGEISYVHRNEVPLHSQGKISLGQRFPENNSDVINYFCKQIDFTEIPLQADPV